MIAKCEFLYVPTMFKLQMFDEKGGIYTNFRHFICLNDSFAGFKSNTPQIATKNNKSQAPNNLAAKPRLKHLNMVRQHLKLT